MKSTPDTDLTTQESHFAFGQNWASYAKGVGETEIREAESALKSLLGEEFSLAGMSFLDIGSGSGLHSLAALRLGAARVVSVDIDPDSVATTRSVLERHATGANFQVMQASVFDLPSCGLGEFDVVYSWGVLHHTGDMNRAIDCAARMVGQQGLLAIALYRRVRLDWFWIAEKRWYARASKAAQKFAQNVFISLHRVAMTCVGRSFSGYVATYRGQRGMDYRHDVHDWLGGWPYESVSEREIDGLMAGYGFARVLGRVREGRWGGPPLGLFGSGCDEYVYRRVSAAAAASGAGRPG